MTEVVGLNKLHKRLIALENKMSEGSVNDTGDHQIVSDLKKFEKDKQASLLANMTKLYERAATDSLTDASEYNIIEIILFTMNFVKQNIDGISKTLSIRPSDELELVTCISLIHSLDYDMYSSTMLRMSIIQLRKLLSCQDQKPKKRSLWKN